MSQLSIIIINYNTFALSCACIASIYTHTKDVEYEIILVDNASKECNPDAFLEKFPEITLIKSPKNLGFAGGNNLGLERAKGEYILLLNSDTELTENSIKICLDKFQNNTQNNTNLGVISCGLLYPNNAIQHCTGKFPTVFVELVELFRVQKFVSKTQKENLLLGAFFDHKSEKIVDWVWGTFFLTKRDIINKLPQKKLPDDFFMYFEDVQWCYKIRKLGYEVFYTPQTKIIHHLSASSTQEFSSADILVKFKKILPNETAFLLKEKGKFYTYLLYFFRMMKFFTLKGDNFRLIAKFYFQYLKNNLQIIS